ncbi:hypothetical protein [Alloyangia pacifica]|uniref:Uncharacterized protein n=1 Tax=Alloyangia pacifica TaxID=311180 RepID=A0A1I6PPM7_9RHOB|nr:hypothetical protein [Alloyangia pacifica]SDG32660.1 hypothetical protein SAMN04488245_102379 [Alloyangia pacifica]SFS42070.1 hypothetical protein SAMN04488050_101680 [Alloyangia pacifica]
MTGNVTSLHGINGAFDLKGFDKLKGPAKVEIDNPFNPMTLMEGHEEINLSIVGLLGSYERQYERVQAALARCVDPKSRDALDRYAQVLGDRINAMGDDLGLFLSDADLIEVLA